MAREVLLYFFTCLGAFFLGRYSLFNLASLIVAYIHKEHEDEDLGPERRHAFFAIGILIILFILVSMLFGLELFFVKLTVLLLFFGFGLLLAVQYDIILLEKSEVLYREKEEERIRGEFFFWLGILFVIFMLSLFIFS